MSQRSFTKDVHCLYKNINSLSGGQATVCECEDKGVIVEISPLDGYYEGGKFKFRISPGNDYPNTFPIVTCLTDIYHPNIDMEGIDYYSDDEEGDMSNVCVSTLDEWKNSMTLEDCVQALLFLFYNPNASDALSELFPISTSYTQTNEDEVFAENVKISLRGGCIEGRKYEQNYGMVNCENTKHLEHRQVEIKVNDLNDENLNEVKVTTNKGEAIDITRIAQNISDLVVVDQEVTSTVSPVLTIKDMDKQCDTLDSPSTNTPMCVEETKGHNSMFATSFNVFQKLFYTQARPHCFVFDNLMPCSTILSALCDLIYTRTVIKNS